MQRHRMRFSLWLAATQLTIMLVASNAANAAVIDQGTTITATHTLAEILAAGGYIAILNEPPASANSGEFLNLTITGLQWDRPTLFQLTDGSVNSDQAYFYNAGASAKVVFLSDDENGNLPPWPISGQTPPTLPNVITNAEGTGGGTFRATNFTGNNGAVSFIVTGFSDGEVPAPDVVSLTPEPSTLALLSIGLIGFGSFRRQQKKHIGRPSVGR